MNPNRDRWLSEAKGVARRVNLAWWLESLSAPLLVTSLLGAVALLVARRELPDAGTWTLLGPVIGGLLALAIGCLARAAGKFEKPEDSLVRIEAAMRMRNSLSAAQAGVAPWPAPVNKIDAGISWQWPRLVAPPLAALALLAAGWFIPLSATSFRTAAPEEPQAWQQLSTELDRLTKEEVVDEAYLEDTRKRIDELKAQEEEQWFSHSSLEATDTLKNSHRAETERVAKELGRAGKALAELEKNARGMNTAAKNRLIEEFDQALQGLQNGAMKPNPQLLEQMKGLDLKEMANLTPEQMEQLRENLAKHGQALRDGQGGGEGEDWSDELLAGDDGPEGNGPGNGGVDRGPGHAGGVLGAEKEGLETGALTGIGAKDLSQATPGDLLELQDGEHQVDQSASAISQGGETEATGKGGDRVWKDRLDPAEQLTLKRFFE